MAKQRWIAALVHASPIWLGVPVWLAFAGRDLMYYFAPGLFMLAAGLIVSVLARLTAKGFVRAHAASALRFQAWILLAVPVWALGFPIAAIFDPPNPTMDNPPAGLQIVLGIGVFAFGFILPFVELIRVIIGIQQARRGPAV